MPQSFLQAEWRKLVIANYVIDPDILLSNVPAGTELDLWEGRCYVSLVGFKFLNTRLLGVKVPGHINFEEVNLRFYVKRGDKRGVVFIKEIVPKPALTFVANTIYKEHYQTLPMRHTWVEAEDHQLVNYEWKMDGKWQRFELTADRVPQVIPEGSETEFITEHYWGYAKISDKKTNEYEVTHPRWQTYPVRSFKIEVDFGKVYGKKFHFLSDIKPVSVMLAEGSEITVEQKITHRF
jgi:hypothetical protein